MKKDEVKRVELIIKNDRLNLKDDYENLLKKDLGKVLSNYFEYREGPEVSILKNGSLLSVEISLCATSLRIFSSMPK